MPITAVNRAGRARSLRARGPLAALLCLLVLAGTRAATAQGVPDPIASPDLDRYASILGMSFQQRSAIDPIHDEYLDRYRALGSDLDVDLAELESQARRWMFDFWSDEDRDRAMRRLEAIVGEARSLDDAFIARLAGVLTEEQAVGLARVRDDRARQRLLAGRLQAARFINRAASIDVSAEVARLDLDGATRTRIEPSLRSYESSFTSALAELERDMTRLMGEARTRFAEMRGGDDGRRGDWRAIQEIMTELGRDFAGSLASVASLNQRTAESIGSMLPSRAARRLEIRMLEQGYGEVAGFPRRLDDRFDEARASSQVTGEIERAVDQLYAAFASRIDGIVDEMVRLEDRKRLERPLAGMPMRGNDDDDDEFEEALDDLRGRARLALDEADRALDAILADVGVELSAREDDEDEDDRGDPFGWRRSGGADGSAGGRFRLDPGDRAASGFGAGTGVDACLPRPIGGAELTRWARGAGLDEDTVLLVQTLHEQYLADWKALEEAFLAARPAPSGDDGDRGDGGDRRVRSMSTDDVERLWELRMETLATLTEADAALVSDLEILMPDEDAVAALESLAAQRRRGVLASVGSDVNRGRFMQSLEGREWAVDLVGLATDPDLGFGPAFAARPALSRWANETMPLLQSRHDALMSVGRTWDALMAWRVEQSRDRGNGDGRRGRERGRDAGDLRARWQSAMELGERVSQIEGRLASLNRETAERLRSELDATANQRFADAYLTRAFPAAVGPRREMERLVGRVLELPDLTEDQRMDIREAQASFDESARELQDRVVSIYREATGSDASGRDGWREIRRRREQFSEIEFDQRELDEKTRRRILAVLTPDQAELIGPLASERP